MLPTTTEERDLLRKVVSSMAAEYLLLLTLYGEVMLMLFPGTTHQDHHDQLNERLQKINRGYLSSPESQQLFMHMTLELIKKHVALASQVDTIHIQE